MPSEQTQTTTSAPYAPAQPGLQSLLDRAEQLGGQTRRFRPVMGETTRSALSGFEGVANQGSEALAPLQNIVGGSGRGFQAGLGQLSDTAAGKYLDPSTNPALQGILDRATRDTANATNQQFSGAGRYGSGSHAAALADRIGGVQSGVLMDHYNRERQNQMGAAGTLNAGGYQGAALAPAIDQARLFTPQLLQQVGGVRDAYTQAMREAPLRAAEWQSGMTVPIAGLGGTSTTENSSSNPMGMLAGGLMTGLGVMTGNPMMAMGGLSGMAGGSMGGMSGMPTSGMYGAGVRSPWQMMTGGGPYASNSMFNINSLI